MAERLLEVRNEDIFLHRRWCSSRRRRSRFVLNKGETIGIVGESGCSKSVTSLSIMRLIPDPPGKIIDGEILFEGSNLLEKTKQK